jgi:dipeptidyl aminopeptidase/acylaminoacyl peptidase
MEPSVPDIWQESIMTFRNRAVRRACLCLLVIASLAASGVLSVDAQGRRPIELEDILAWKGMSTSIVSNDGRWLAYRLSPAEGDSEVVVRATDGDKEYRFTIGEIPRPSGNQPPGPPPAGGAAESLAFAADSRWAAFTTYPTRQEATRLRAQRRPADTTVVLVDLATGTDRRFEKTQRFAFSGDAAGWLAIHRAPAERAPARPEGTGQRPAATPERPRGSDLILHELATGHAANIGNVADFAFDRSGRWLAVTIDAADQTGNGLQLREMATGVVTVLDSGKAWYSRPTWTEKGDGLTVLKGVEDKSYRDKLYSALGFTELASRPARRVVFDPATDPAFPSGMTISPNRAATWTEDLGAIFFGIHALKKKDPTERAAREEMPPPGGPNASNEPTTPDEEKVDLILWHWQDPRLQSQQQVQAERDRRFSYLSIYRVADRKFLRLADEEVREVVPASRGGRWAVGFDSREYDIMGSLDGRRYQDVYSVDLTTGDRKLAARRVRWFSGLSPVGKHFLYFEDGHYHAYAMETGQITNITRTAPVSFVDAEDDHNVVRPPVQPMGWSADGATVLLSDGWDVWNVPVTGGPAVNLTVDGRRDSLRYRRRFPLDPDEKGIDLTAPLYVQVYGEWTKQQGIVRLEPGRPGPRRLVWDAAQFSRLMKAKNADVFVYSRETYADAPDLYATDASLASGRRLTDVGAAQSAFAWSDGSMLVDYTGAKGDKLQAALFLPAGYQKGQSYPTVVYIYERLSQDLNRYFAPTANGFNKSVYTSHGYAVLMPDIKYRVNDPGMSAVWCVLPALKAAIATGVVDEKRVALHGHSWGGYQTSFLVTQTPAFRAAIAGAPLTNLVSMYSLIYKNTGGTNQPIFESSQGRFLGGYWDHWDAYLRNSPVFSAKNVTTPLMILHNDQDGAVDFTQGVEYFNTLRRLRKPVIMLEYVGENHGLRKPANQQDYTVRMKEFFDHHLKGAPAPDWLANGVDYLELEDHLKGRARKKPADRAKTTTPDR